MSRIYEALARANDVIVEPAPADPAPPATTALEQYAQEGRHVVIDHRPVMRPVPPPVTTVVDPYQSIVPVADFEGKVIDGSAVHAMAADQYSSLATALHEMQLDGGLKTVLVTSAAPQEGKTLTVVNLAITLANSYARRVLIVDADLRRPSLHRALGVAGDRGLSDALSRASGDVAITQISPRISVLPAGRPDPNPLVRLSHSRLQQMLADWTTRFDWVLVDTPPLGSGSDAQLLARLVQGVIFVIRAGVAPYHVVERAIAQLGRESIIGTVLNGVDEASVPAVLKYQIPESNS
jgi:capsular exopolysaccharide synthesis family protein